MNGKILIASIGIFLLLLFTGIYFVYNSLSNEEIPEKDDISSPVINKKQKSISQSSSSSSSPSSSPIVDHQTVKKNLINSGNSKSRELNYFTPH